MKQQESISFNQYRTVDISILLILTVVLESVITLAATQWFSEGLIFSVTLLYALTAVAIMRWGWRAILVPVADSLAMCICMGASPQQYIAYTVGSVASLVVLLMHKYIGKKKIRESFWFSTLYVAVIYLAINLGRALLLGILGQNLSVFGGLITADSLSAVFAVVVVFVCRRQDGLFEDQRTYLIRTEDIRRKALQKAACNEEEVEYAPTPQQVMEDRDDESSYK